MAERPRITVSMMVKNEEDLLPQALASVRELADEIVVVDTGSSDRTVEIAQAAGAKVFHHAWEFDFAKHRNQSMEYAGGDWIFILDADEELAPGAAKLLRDAVAKTPLDAITIPVHSVSEGGAHESGHNSMRLFRASAKIRYKGAVHNEVDFAGQSLFVPAKLLHHGYNLSPEKMAAKFTRTTDLLKREMAAEPENPKWPHYLAISYHTEHLYPEALEMAEKSILLCGDSQDVQRNYLTNYYVAAACRLQLKDLEGAEVLCRRALTLFADYLDAWAVLSSIAFISEDGELLLQAVDRFLELYERYQDDPQHFATYPLHTLHHQASVLVRLAMWERRQGRQDRFAELYAQAKRVARDTTDVVLSAVTYLERIGLADEALGLLEDEISVSMKPDLVERMAHMLIRQDKIDRALAVVASARQNGMPDADAAFLEGQVFLVAGRAEDAKARFESVLAADPARVEAHINLGLALEKMQKIDEAEACYHAAIDQDPSHLDAAVCVADLYARNERLDDAIAFYEKITEIAPTRWDIHMTLAYHYWDRDNVDALLNRLAFVARRLGLELPQEVESAEQLGELFDLVGQRLWQLREQKGARLSFEIACNLLPGRTETRLRFGEALLVAGAAQAAIKPLEQAAKLSPEDWRPFELLGRVYEMLGAEEAAALCQEKVVELKKDIH